MENIPQKMILEVRVMNKWHQTSEKRKNKYEDQKLKM